jgi:hypothetical protein
LASSKEVPDASGITGMTGMTGRWVKRTVLSLRCKDDV